MGGRSAARLGSYILRIRPVDIADMVALVGAPIAAAWARPCPASTIGPEVSLCLDERTGPLEDCTNAAFDVVDIDRFGNDLVYSDIPGAFDQALVRIGRAKDHRDEGDRGFRQRRVVSGRMSARPSAPCASRKSRNRRVLRPRAPRRRVRYPPRRYCRAETRSYKGPQRSMRGSACCPRRSTPARERRKMTSARQFRSLLLVLG